MRQLSWVVNLPKTELEGRPTLSLPLSPRLDLVAFARTALTNVRSEFPNHTAHVVTEPGEDTQPSHLHPAFYGSYDWHSAVHMHWLLVKLLGKLDPVEHADLRNEIVTLLDEHLSEANMRTEARYLETHTMFERPYGYAWALSLHAALAEAEHRTEPAVSASVRSWLAAVSHLTEALLPLCSRWITTTPAPQRYGVHGNSAFAMIMLHDAGRALAPLVQGAEQLADLVHAQALSWFGDDTNAPVAWEPSSYDFLSPALCEAALMSRVLDRTEFARWITAFIPLPEGTAEDLPQWLRAPIVTDPEDGQQGHLYGLGLTRAWNIRDITAALESGVPTTEPLRAALIEARPGNLAFGVAAATDTSNFLHTHWLASFAFLATEDEQAQN